MRHRAVGCIERAAVALECRVPFRDGRLGKPPCCRFFLHPPAVAGDSVGVNELRSVSADDVVGLVRAHQTEVWRYLRFLGASNELADDLTQETFLQLLRAPFVQRSERETAGWLRTVARNLWVRSFRRPPFDFADLDAMEAAWTGFAGDDQGEAAVADLRACLGQLTGRARDVVQWHYEERRSRRAIGDRLGIGEDGVKSLLRRTREVLRACIERRRQQGEGHA